QRSMRATQRAASSAGGSTRHWRRSPAKPPVRVTTIAMAGASSRGGCILLHADVDPGGPDGGDLLRILTVLRLRRRQGGAGERGEIRIVRELTPGEGAVPDQARALPRVTPESRGHTVERAIGDAGVD